MVQNLIITSPELVELTGYSRAADQASCLRSHGIFYVEGKDGRIRTTWYHINHPASHRNNNNDGFNLEALA
ncbi:hypothetical protein C0W59_02860 [Photobacterium kishitanii]|nr:hypothetical protein C0W59_02860 [Photobacterium kishitanii]